MHTWLHGTCEQSGQPSGDTMPCTSLHTKDVAYVMGIANDLHIVSHIACDQRQEW